MRLISSRVERDSSGVVDDAAQRQHGAVANDHRPGYVCDRRLIKYEVVCTKRSRGYAVERDHLPVCQRDHRIAIGIRGQMIVHIIEAGKPGIADEIDLVLAGIEAVDDVVADRLRENE